MLLWFSFQGHSSNSKLNSKDELNKRLHSTVVVKKTHSPDLNWENWDQTDLEYEDEKVLEKRRQLLQRELELQMKREKEEQQRQKKDKKSKKVRVSHHSIYVYKCNFPFVVSCHELNIEQPQALCVSRQFLRVCHHQIVIYIDCYIIIHGNQNHHVVNLVEHTGLLCTQGMMYSQ
jgi:hypothetical protein